MTDSYGIVCLVEAEEYSISAKLPGAAGTLLPDSLHIFTKLNKVFNQIIIPKQRYDSFLGNPEWRKQTFDKVHRHS